MSAVDREIADLADGQHGVVATRQLRALGLSATSQKRRVAERRLRRLHTGVYAVGEVYREGRWLAAALALGPDAVLSHRDAAALHGLRRSDRRTVDVTVPRKARSRRGITVHATRALHADDRTTIDGIPVTSISRTLLDLAEILGAEQLRRAYEEAERLRVLDSRAIRNLMERSNGRHGISSLRALLEYDPASAANSRSALESRFLDLLRENGLPLPQLNVLVAGYLVDAHWPRARLVIELQGYRYHSHRTAFERDHAKLGRLKLAGYEVLPLTWRQLVADADWVVEAIGALLARAESPSPSQTANPDQPSRLSPPRSTL